MTRIVAGQTIGRAPFTVFLTVAIAVAGWLTGSWRAHVPPALIDRWGFAPADLWHGRGWTYITATFLNDRPLMFWGILVFAALVVGGYERKAGFGRTLLVFWAGGLAAQLIACGFVGLPLALAGSPLAGQFISLPDVGMSAGGFVCLGGLIAGLGARARLPAAVLVYLFIALKMVFRVEPFADAIHMVALPLGILVETGLQRRAGSAKPR